MKKKNKLKLWVFGIICFMMFSTYVNAASVSVKASASSITKGNTVTFTATVSSSSPIVSIEGSLSCSGAGVNGGTSLTFDDMSNNIYSKSFTYTAKPTSTGTVTCTISGGRLTDMGSSDWQSLNNSSVSVTVKDAVVIPPKEYSSDNTLSGLSVDGYDISPKFSKDTLEYTLEVDETVEKIKVNATANDNNASVSGSGEKSLTSGENTIEIKVTAENGNEKVYKIIVTVKDKNPITVTVDKKKYTIVKKNHDIIEVPEYYEESTIKIDDQDVVCYKNEKSNITLIILKDEDNKVGYYIYEEKNKTYKLYNTIKIGNITLSILDMDSKLLPDGYKKYTLEIDNTKIEGYKLNKDSNFYLIYAMNIENGKKSLYLYDKKENIIGRYDEDISKYYSNESKEKSKKYKIYFCVSLSALLAVTIVLIGLLVKNHKGKKRKNIVKL